MNKRHDRPCLDAGLLQPLAALFIQFVLLFIYCSYFSILVFILDNCIEAVSGIRPPVALVVYEPEIKGRGGAQSSDLLQSTIGALTLGSTLTLLHYIT